MMRSLKRLLKAIRIDELFLLAILLAFAMLVKRTILLPFTPFAMLQLHDQTLRYMDIQTVTLRTRVPFSAMRIFNPSLARHNGQLWMYARFRGDHQQQTSSPICPNTSLLDPMPCPTAKLEMVSFTARCPVSTEMRCLDALEVLPYPLRWDLAERFELVQVLGPEDPRTIDHHGNVFQLVNGPPQQPVPRSSAMYRTMAALDVSWHAPRLMKIQNVYPTIERPIDLVLNATMERIEKNWSPIMFVSDRVLRLSRLFQPHQVVDCDTQTGRCWHAATTNLKSDILAQFRLRHGYTAVHLGTNYIRASEGSLLAIAHLTKPVSRSLPPYLNLVYAISSSFPHPVIGISNVSLSLPTKARQPTIVWTSSLWRNNSEVVIGYTEDDSTAAFARSSLQELSSTLIDV
eukprot:TRINITY_DN11920_c0_g2_i3.p1 TRINITY_DN11920_c0_g2~~TRINITY_DN11920_c0_g2_i3.p1  ORF type:complete len:402 (+),score=52.22 TRINITY_DN11920_c0_g2_i3:85-1290(+)